MSLHHTIRLYDYDYKDMMGSLKEHHFEPTIILTRLNKTYFDNEITIEKMEEFGSNMLDIMNSQSSLYCVIQSNLIGEVIIGFKNAGLVVRNILAIPVNKHYCMCDIKNRTYYDENKTMYVVFATKGCHARNLNFTKFVRTEGSCVYPSIWSWFIGSEEQAFETIIKISSDHRDEIFDPFMGDGTIGEATIKADRRFIGTEPDGAIFRATKDKLDRQGE